MKKIILSAIFIIQGFLTIVQAQQFKWVKGGGTAENIDHSITPGAWNVEGTYYMCTDENGNIYALNEVGNDAIVADSFYSSNPYGSSANVLFTSYNCSGQMRFARLITSTTTIPHGLLTDNAGHIYMAMDVPHNPALRIGDTTINTYTDDREAVMQFDTSGHLKWIQFEGDNTPSTYNNTGGDYNLLALDGSGNIHLISYVNAGVHLTGTVTSHLGTYDLAYNSSGTLLSAKQLQLDSTLITEKAVISNSGKLYITGEHSVNYGTDQFFTAAFDVNRNNTWIYFLDTLGGTAAAALTSIANDNYGNLYFCGSGLSVITLGPTTFRFRNDSVMNALMPDFNYMSVIMKTDTNANPIWIKHYDGNSNNTFNSITVSSGNKVAAVGLFYENMISGTDTLNAGVGIDPFFAVTDTAGNLISLKGIHGDGYYDLPNIITSDRNGNLYIGGQVEDSITAGGIPAYHTVGGNTDFFIIKYGYDCNCAAPVANYTYSGTTSNINFNYNGTTASLDSVVWNFGNGTSGTGTTVTHTYTSSGTYTVCATAYAVCGSDTHCSSIAVATSVSNLAAFPDLNVYPNPMSEELFVAHAPIGTVVKLFNIMGQQVYSGNVTSDRQQVNTSDLSVGTYVLQLTGPDGSKSGITIVKQ